MTQPRDRPRIAVTTAVLLVTGLLIVGCGPSPTPSTLENSDESVSALGPGFLGSNPSPSPEATISPEAGSWDGVEPPPDYEIALITAAGDPTADTLARGVLSWAAARDIPVKQWIAGDEDAIEHYIVEASMGPDQFDLVVGAGRGIVDVFALLTSQHLETQFLVVGAQLPEPTHNVTAVVWDGASFRGTGISEPSDTEDQAISEARAETATSAGVASIVHDHTGIVLHLE